MTTSRLAARLCGERVDDLLVATLEQVGLSHCAGDRPASLSGGMRQRVALARTLYEDCPIVLMDEPFSALDTLTRTRIQTLAAELLADRTVLLIIHDRWKSAGSAIACCVALALSIIISPGVQRWLMPLVLTSQAIPVFALAPLLWLGFGMSAKVMMAVLTLDKSSKTPADLQGEKVGYSVRGIEQTTLNTIAKNAHIDPQIIRLVNVNFQLTSSLLAGQVDAVIGGYRNY